MLEQFLPEGRLASAVRRVLPDKTFKQNMWVPERRKRVRRGA